MIKKTLCIYLIFISGLTMLAVLQSLVMQSFLTANAQANDYSNKTKMNVNSTLANATLAINSLTAAFGDPFYELGDTESTGTELLSIDPIQVKESYVGTGLIKGVGNVTEQGTYVETYGIGGPTSVGKGMIRTEDGYVITFTAEDNGTADDKGNLLYRGMMYFNSNQTAPKLGFLDKKIGMYLYQERTDGEDWSKVWIRK
jgi:hypothetical protein